MYNRANTRGAQHHWNTPKKPPIHRIFAPLCYKPSRVICSPHRKIRKGMFSWNSSSCAFGRSYIFIRRPLIIIIYCYIGKLHVILISFNISPGLRNQSMLSLLISPIYLIFNTDTQQLRGWNPLKRNDSTSVAPVVAWDLYLLVECSLINILRPRQNGRLFQDGILKWIFLNQSERIAIKILLIFLPRVPINSIPALVQIMAWRQAIIWTNDG